jgi:arylsulfatase A-like enzyme
MVLGIDLAPTFLELAGIKAKPAQMQGASMLPLLKSETPTWRDKVFYEYYWESAFPQTPTIFAVRSDRYKYIFNYGTWDINELYDLKEDPNEMNNLIRDPAMAKKGLELREQLFKWMDETNGLNIPLKQQRGRRGDNLYKGTY